MKAICLIAFLFASTLLAFGQTQPQTHVTRESGGTIQSDSSLGFPVNRGSSLMREWIAVHDDALPIKMVGTPGVRVVYASDRATSGYYYRNEIPLEAVEPITAVELRFVILDVFGRYIKTLNFTYISDIEKTDKLLGSWSIPSRTEVSEFYCSIAYIANVRTKAGRVIKGNTDAVVAEAQKMNPKFTAEILDLRIDNR